MPKVNGKKFPYTLKGKTAAKAAAKKMPSHMKSMRPKGGKV